MTVMQKIRDEVEKYPIVLFMKGTPQFPMCGFSARAVQALQDAGVEDLHTVNVMEDPEVRANLPRYSNWPTFPPSSIREVRIILVEFILIPIKSFKRVYFFLSVKTPTIPKSVKNRSFLSLIRIFPG